MSRKAKNRKHVSRAGAKLEHGLAAFGLDVSGFVCADFGCNVGGFTDCLLKRGAARVHAIDTGYGTLAYSLRSDDRVNVMERTNALHAEVVEPVDLVVIDLAWTPQSKSIPVALGWLKPGGRIVTLIKPHYELSEDEKAAKLVDGKLPADDAPAVCDRVVATMPALGMQVIDVVQSPLTGGKSGVNVEFLALGAAGEDA